MAGFRFRLVDRHGAELAALTYAMHDVQVGETVYLPGARVARVLEVRWHEASDEPDAVRATLVVDASLSSLTNPLLLAARRGGAAPGRVPNQSANVRERLRSAKPSDPREWWRKATSRHVRPSPASPLLTP
jgi:hypothetical protein